MWYEGSIEFNSKLYTFEIKRYEQPSKFGISNGRVSKLFVKKEDKIAIEYDRGWIKTPIDKYTSVVLDILINDDIEGMKKKYPSYIINIVK